MLARHNCILQARPSINAVVTRTSVKRRGLFTTVALRSTLRKMTNFKIDIVSDTVCPWCYVGKNRLEKAIEKHKSSNPDDTFTTSWFPFYLNPDAPKSIDKEEYYHRKFGAQRTQ